MTYQQAIQKYGSLKVQMPEKKHTLRKPEKNASSADNYVAQIMTVITPYLLSNITDEHICNMQIKIAKILNDYKKI